MEEDAHPGPPPRTWLVDGFNVIHAGVVSGRERGEWWREPERLQLLERVQGFVAGELEAGAEVWVVFDGGRPAQATPDDPRLHVVFAPSADAWVLAHLRGAEDPGRIAVVTRDRRLAARARHRGARVVGPRWFLSRCAEPAPSA